jgi:hypothetical protein
MFCKIYGANWGSGKQIKGSQFYKERGTATVFAYKLKFKTFLSH